MSASFRGLCETVQKIRETSCTQSKIAICSDYLESIRSDDDLVLAAQFIGEGAFSNNSGKRASVGSRTAGLAVSEFCGIDYKLVFKPCRKATGDTPETVARLMDNIPEAIEKRTPEDLTLRQLREWFYELSAVSTRAEKIKVLQKLWSRLTPVEVKYSIRMIGQKSLQAGFDTQSLIAAITKAFGQSFEEVEFVHTITGSAGDTALMARRNRLKEAEFQFFHPLPFMPASSIHVRSVDKLKEYFAEEKFSGMRGQLHLAGDRIELYSRDFKNITKLFPDITDVYKTCTLPDIVLDGEICVYKERAIQPRQYLQKRIGIKKPTAKIQRELPALFIAYDILCIEGKPLLNETLAHRRERLESLAESGAFPIANQYSPESLDDLNHLLERALARGNEGLILKPRYSRYEYRDRGGSWLKIIKPGETVHAVVMYAHGGSGKRNGLYADFTIGVSVQDDERFEEEFIPIGKINGPYSDKELAEINSEVKELTVEKYGPTLGLLPGLIIEIEFDNILVNRRTKAGYALIKPRFSSIRRNLTPSDADTLRQVEKLYTKRVEEERLVQDNSSSFIMNV